MRAGLKNRNQLTTFEEETVSQVEVLIVDDHPMVLEGLAGILARHQIKTTGLAANGRQAIELYLERKPDVVLLDLRLPDLSGFDVIRTILNSDAEARIVVLSVSQRDASYIQPLPLERRVTSQKAQRA